LPDLGGNIHIDKIDGSDGALLFQGPVWHAAPRRIESIAPRAFNLLAAFEIPTSLVVYRLNVQPLPQVGQRAEAQILAMFVCEGSQALHQFAKQTLVQ
jgi:hypothetical protein